MLTLGRGSWAVSQKRIALSTCLSNRSHNMWRVLSHNTLHCGTLTKRSHKKIDLQVKTIFVSRYLINVFFFFPFAQIRNYKADIEQLGHEFDQQAKEFEEEKRKLLKEERAKADKETSIMRSKLKTLSLQLFQMKTFMEKLKREQQDLRISCLKLGTSVKPAVREVAKQVSMVVKLSISDEGIVSCSQSASRGPIK